MTTRDTFRTLRFMSYSDFRQIIALWGDGTEGLDAFAGDIGVTRLNAKQMRTRNSVHPRHWEKLVAAAAEREFPGITLSVLLRLKSQGDALRRRAAAEQCQEPA